MDTRARPIYMLSIGNPLQTSRTHGLKVRGWKTIFHANKKQKKGGVAIHTSDKIDLKIKKITRDKEGHYMMIKGSIQEEDITIANIYAPNIEAPQYIRQTLADTKGEIDSNTMIVGTNITEENIHKNPQQNTSKSTVTIN